MVVDVTRWHTPDRRAILRAVARVERRNATQAWLVVIFALAAVLAAWAVPA